MLHFKQKHKFSMSCQIIKISEGRFFSPRCVLAPCFYLHWHFALTQPFMLSATSQCDQILQTQSCALIMGQSALTLLNCVTTKLITVQCEQAKSWPPYFCCWNWMHCWSVHFLRTFQCHHDMQTSVRLAADNIFLQGAVIPFPTHPSFFFCCVCLVHPVPNCFL